MTDDRREFIKKLAKGAVYAAPAVMTMTAPAYLAGAQHGKSSQKKMNGGGKGKSSLRAQPREFPPPPPGRG